MEFRKSFIKRRPVGIATISNCRKIGEHSRLGVPGQTGVGEGEDNVGCSAGDADNHLNLGETDDIAVLVSIMMTFTDLATFSSLKKYEPHQENSTVEWHQEHNDSDHMEHEDPVIPNDTNDPSYEPSLNYSSDSGGSDNSHNHQPFVGSVPAGNLAVSSAILNSGALPTKVLRLMNFMNIPTISHQTFFNHQRLILYPAVSRFWKHQQSQHIARYRDATESYVLGGDGRADTPGHSAKYGSYSMMDLKQGVIIDIQLVQFKTSCRKRLFESSKSPIWDSDKENHPIMISSEEESVIHFYISTSVQANEWKDEIKIDVRELEIKNDKHIPMRKGIDLFRLRKLQLQNEVENAIIPLTNTIINEHNVYQLVYLKNLQCYQNIEWETVDVSVEWDTSDGSQTSLREAVKNLREGISNVYSNVPSPQTPVHRMELNKYHISLQVKKRKNIPPGGHAYITYILYHRTTTTQDKQIATNDDQDSLDILLTTTTRDNTVATNDNTFQTTQHKLDRIISLLEKN
ncbi:unnamed protein product [Mytilus coruscus]|uniref:Uncharacterized protein n=1 Tax=Mytilus coruscus TaxID=42192 RepID=A0A6J8C7C7_MYTCO|nr:unnamed protein product [Mytilus coruscus]